MRSWCTLITASAVHKRGVPDPGGRKRWRPAAPPMITGPAGAKPPLSSQTSGDWFARAILTWCLSDGRAEDLLHFLASGRARGGYCKAVAFQDGDGAQGCEQCFLKPDRNASSVTVACIGMKSQGPKEERRFPARVIPFRMVCCTERHVEEEPQELLGRPEPHRKHCLAVMPVSEIMRHPAQH